MMAEQHTPEPWRYYSLETDGMIIRRKGTFEIGTPEYAVCADVTGGGPIRKEADACRIVAVVNACKGITTEALEAGVVAELLAACEASLYTGDKTVREVREQLRAAIAKARGKVE